MSELKEHQFCECDEFFREYHGPLSNETHLYYLKSEADKVISDLEESHEREVEQLLMEIVELKKKLDLYKRGLAENDKINDNLYAELRHHKYKRCLAMAYWCSAELGMLVSTWESKIRYYKRWQKRWLELAEHLKEAK